MSTLTLVKRMGKSIIASGSQTTLYTAPATGGSWAQLQDVQITNYDSAERTITMWIGGTGDEDLLLKDMPVQPGYSTPLKGRKIALAAGETLKAEASVATTITCIASGVEYDAA